MRAKIDTPTYRRAADRHARRIAVTIGVNAYRQTKVWPKLNAAVSDAQRMGKLFEELGFEEVIELYDADADRDRILRLLEYDVPKRVGSNDLVRKPRGLKRARH